MQSRPRHRFAFAALLVVLGWIPIPLGSNRPWSWALLEVMVFLVVALWCVDYLRRPAPAPEGLRAGRWPLALMLSWAVYLLLQLVPLPPDWLAAMSPPTLEAYRALEPAGIEAATALSLDRSATAAEALKLCAYTGLFFLILVLVGSASRLATLLNWILIVGVAEALYGLGIHEATPDLTKGVVGTYVNRNHFAGLMELTIAIALGLMLAHGVGRQGAAGARARLRSIADFLLGRGGWLAFGLLVMVCALIFTTSRGAIVALALAFTLTTALALAARPSGAQELRLVPVVGIVLAFSAIWFGLGGLPDKLGHAGLSSGRAELREVGYRMVSDRPWFGAGAGTFRWVFPGYKDDRFGAGYYEHAHNDFIEIATDQGLVGLGLAVATLASVYAKTLHGLRVRRHPLMRGALFASILGTGSLLVHGLVDFNLQIPANAAYFFVLLGVGVVASSIARGSTATRGVERGARPWRVS